MLGANTQDLREAAHIVRLGAEYARLEKCIGNTIQKCSSECISVAQCVQV